MGHNTTIRRYTNLKMIQHLGLELENERRGTATIVKMPYLRILPQMDTPAAPVNYHAASVCYATDTRAAHPMWMTDIILLESTYSQLDRIQSEPSNLPQ
jgi:hypothetical protein